MTEVTIVPNNRQAEEALIGSVLINADAFLEVAEYLHADDFYIHRHRWIWEAFDRLSDRRVPMDLLTITEELDQMGYLGEIGGPAYLTALINQVPSSLHADAYGHIVEEAAIRRRVLDAANQIAKAAYEEGLTAEVVLDTAEKAVFQVSERRLKRQVLPIGKIISKVYDHAEEASRESKATGSTTGFHDLDQLLGGMQPSDLLIVAGRPGMGKSGYLLSLVRYVAGNLEKHVAIFSLEMSNEQMVQRLIAQESGIDTQRMRSGEIREDEWPGFVRASEKVSEWNIYLDDTPALTPLQLRTRCRKLRMENRLDLVIVDYLQLMRSGERFDNRTLEVGHISQSLKVLARELNLPIFAAAQLSRAVEQRADKRPTLSDLRESGAIEQDSDVVMFLYRPEMYAGDDPALKGLAELIVAKHRNGPTGTVDLTFDAQLTKFKNVTNPRGQ